MIANIIIAGLSLIVGFLVGAAFMYKACAEELDSITKELNNALSTPLIVKIYDAK